MLAYGCKATALGKDGYLSILFLLGADKNQYGKMLDELEDAHRAERATAARFQCGLFDKS
jgi:hypothetical protein